LKKEGVAAMPDHRIQEKRFAFLGAGIIAGVFIERLMKAGIAKPESIIAADPKEGRLEELRNTLGIQVTTDNKKGADFGDIVVLAMPPGAVKAVLSESCQAMNESQLLVSFAAAVPTWLMESVLCKPIAILRVIPNTPSLIGRGMNPYCLGKHVTGTMLPLIRDFLDVFGRSWELEERFMNAATALTAVGPTYVFPVIQALQDAAVKLGLAEADALAAASQTVLGAAAMVLETGKGPEELKMMIATQTLKETEAKDLFALAMVDACAKVSASERKLTQ
jgi:pyrroline-5-carboxylate reductase